LPEVKARDRRRISGFVEDLATQRSGKRAGRSRSDFFNGLIIRQGDGKPMPCIAKNGTGYQDEAVCARKVGPTERRFVQILIFPVEHIWKFPIRGL